MNVTEEQHIAIANVETVDHEEYPSPKSTLAVFFNSESDEQPSEEPHSHDSAPVILQVTGTSVVMNHVQTICIEDESGNTNADVKPKILSQTQKPTSDSSMLIKSEELPSSGEEIPAEQPRKKRNFLNRLRSFFNAKKADRVEKEDKLPEERINNALSILPSMFRTRKPAEPSGAKVSWFKRTRILHRRVHPVPKQE